MSQCIFKGSQITNSSFFPARFKELYWIEVNILGDSFQIAIISYMFRAKRLDEEIPSPFVKSIKIHRICRTYSLHKFTNSPALFRLITKEKVEMIRHKAIGAYRNQELSPVKIEYFLRRLREDLISVNRLSAIGKI